MIGGSIIWIEAGYNILALKGPREINVEQLAKKLGLNKSGFYYYFNDRDTFLMELMNYHDNMGKKFAKELSLLKEFMPGYLELLIKYKTGFQVQLQLRKNFDIPLCKEYFTKVKSRNNRYQISLFSKFMKINDLQLASEIFEILHDLVVTRLKTDEISLDYMTGIFEGIKSTIEKLKLNRL